MNSSNQTLELSEEISSADRARVAAAGARRGQLGILWSIHQKSNFFALNHDFIKEGPFWLLLGGVEGVRYG